MRSVIQKFFAPKSETQNPQNITADRNKDTGFAVLSATLVFMAGGTAFMLARVLWNLDGSNQSLRLSVWFGSLLAVAVGTLCFLAVRAAVSRDSFDDPNTNAYVVLAGVLSFIGIALCYLSLGVWPLGDSSVLVVDMFHQYVEFFALLRDKLLHGGSLLYNQSAGLGQGYIPLMAYYSSSPFNIILLIFPRANLTEAVAVITMLKITFAGVSFAIMAKNIFRRNDFSVVIGGVAYSMMSFFIGHSWNLMWLDPIALLPLTVLGLEMLVRRGKPLLYCAALALTFITNYYMGYMVAIFLVIYFAAHLLAEPKDRLRKFFRFCYGSLIGGGISAAILLPTAIALSHTSGANDSFNREVDSMFNLFSLFGRLLFSAEPNMRGDQLPNIYCSVLAVVLLIIFVSSPKIPLRKRAALGGITALICVTASINWTNLAWHGFHFPNDLPYRYSYLISFSLLYIAMAALDYLDKISLRGVVGGFGVFAALCLIHQSIGDSDVTFLAIYVSLGLALVYAVILALGAAGKIRREVCVALLLLFLFSEAAANGSSVIRQLDKKEHYSTREAFAGDYELRQAAVNAVKGYGQPEFRTSMLEMKVLNDPALFGYSGITTFASSNRESTVKFMEDIGYAANAINCYYHTGYNPFTDSLLGIKYIIFNSSVSHPQLHLTDVISVNSAAPQDDYDYDYDYDYPSRELYIFENEFALPRVFPASRGIIGWSHSKYNNPFAAQNNLARFLGSGGDIYTMRYPGSDSVNGMGCVVSLDDSYFSMSLDGGVNRGSFTVDYIPEEPALIYVYVDCGAAKDANISYGGNTWNARLDEARIIDMGEVPAGEPVSVTISSEGSCGGNVYFAELHIDTLREMIENLRWTAPNFISYGDHYIKAEFTAPANSVLFTSIPYDEGWSAKVDGRKVSTIEMGEALLCVELPPSLSGNAPHTLELSYFPPGLAAGLALSVISLAALILLAIPDEALMKLLPPRLREALRRREPSGQ